MIEWRCSIVVEDERRYFYTVSFANKQRSACLLKEGKERKGRAKINREFNAEDLKEKFQCFTKPFDLASPLLTPHPIPTLTLPTLHNKFRFPPHRHIQQASSRLLNGLDNEISK